jgi:hypothetical protein
MAGTIGSLPESKGLLILLAHSQDPFRKYRVSTDRPLNRRRCQPAVVARPNLWGLRPSRRGHADIGNAASPLQTFNPLINVLNGHTVGNAPHILGGGRAS